MQPERLLKEGLTNRQLNMSVSKKNLYQQTMSRLPWIMLLVMTFSCKPVAPPADQQNINLPPLADQPAPKNIVLLIGDGMGLTQITAGMYRSVKGLALESFPIVGLHKSYSSDNLITDSAAGATAFASGVKTYNGAIGVKTDSAAAPTILEDAESRGLATGLVVTCSITHATPACFYAHRTSRKYNEQIAGDLIGSGVDFLVGGGKKYFDRRKDGKNLLAEMAHRGYTIKDFEEGPFNPADVLQARDKYFYVSAKEEPVTFAQGRTYLPGATREALRFLKNKSNKGFFLMVEGSQIDWGGHANDSEYIIKEMLDFDRAIGEVLEFAKKDGETLVVVTADHETGGYAINAGSTRDTIYGAFTTKSHTAALIPVFAYGPGSKQFSGIYENTAIYHKMMTAWGRPIHQVQATGSAKSK